MVSYNIERANNDGVFKLVETLYPKNNGEAESYTASLQQETNNAQYRIHIISKTTNWYSTVAVVKTNCAEKESLSILPNPIYAGISDVVKLRYFSEQSIASSMISIYDINGKLVQSKSIPIEMGLNEYKLPVNSLSRGVYFIRLSHSGEYAKLSIW